MKLSFLSFFIIGACHFFADAMHGGKIGKIERVPYMAQLYNRFESGEYNYCGAAILSDRWILTAAHCISKADNLVSEQIRVKAQTTYGEEGIYHNISQIVPHSKYSTDTRWQNDVALIEVKEPIQFDEKSQPISIAKTAPKFGDVVTVSGYGDDYKIWGENLKVGRQSIISKHTCRENYKKASEAKITIDSRVFCTDSSELDLCLGDSGSPGVINGKVVGVAVEGCDSPLPNIYINVANYYDWIVNVTGIKFE